MKPISAWTASAQEKLQDSTIILERKLLDYRLEVVFTGYSLWCICHWSNGERIAFRAGFSGLEKLTLDNVQESKGIATFTLSGNIGKVSVALEIPNDEKPIFRYTSTIIPVIDLLIPYWPRDIMPLFKENGKTQNTNGTIHASQVGLRSGQLYFTMDYPKAGSVFYFQNLTALNKFCETTETSAGDLVGGSWPEIGMKLPATTVENPLKADEEYIVSDAFILLSDSIPTDNYEIAENYLNYLAEIYLLLPKPETTYHDWREILKKGLSNLSQHKGCWKFADGQSYLNAYVSDYKTPPESMVQLAVLLPLTDYDRWSGEDHHSVIETLQNGLENFFDPNLKTIVRWLPKLEKNLDWSEEQKQPDVMDSWYLHHPLLNLSRLALRGDEIAKKLLLNSADYVINVARTFNYKWPVFYKMSTLEILKEEIAEGKGGEKDVAGSYAHLMLQLHELTGKKEFLDEATKAALTLDGLGFDLFYQANNTAFSAGALLKLYKITGNEKFLRISNLCLANIFKNVQLWESNYGNAKHFSTFFGIYPLSDAPYTAPYEEQEVFSALHEYLNIAEDVAILPSLKILIPECLKYVINRVAYYYPPMLVPEILASPEEVKTGEIDQNLWIAIEDLQDGWNKSGQVGQEVYGAGVAFGIVPRQYYKIPEANLIVFTEYPARAFKKIKNTLTFSIYGNPQIASKVSIMTLDREKAATNFSVAIKANSHKKTKLKENKTVDKDRKEFLALGDSSFTVTWDK